MAELKSCPCCGGKAGFIRNEGMFADFLYIKCEDCGIQTNSEIVHKTEWKTENPIKKLPLPSKEEAEEKLKNIWNRRADNG